MKFCSKCGKELMDEAIVCPNCGCAVEAKKVPIQNGVPKSAKNAKLFGILSLLVLAPLGIPAIVLANQSKEETGGEMCSDAKTGFICGIIGLSFWGLMLLILLAEEM